MGVIPRPSETKSRRKRRRSEWRGWESDGKDQPEVRCERIVYASSRTSHVQAGIQLCYRLAILRARRTLGKDPNQTRGPTSQGAAHPAQNGGIACRREKHMANHQDADGHALLLETQHVTTCRATMNYPTSSSGSQSIRHTSPRNCTCDTEANRVAGILFWAFIASAQQRPAGLFVCQGYSVIDLAFAATTATSADIRCSSATGECLVSDSSLQPSSTSSQAIASPPKTSVLAGAR